LVTLSAQNDCGRSVGRLLDQVRMQIVEFTFLAVLLVLIHRIIPFDWAVLALCHLIFIQLQVLDRLVIDAYLREIYVTMDDAILDNS
jgi:hypothetical protein